MFSLCWTRSHRSVAFDQTEPFRCHWRIKLGVTDFTAEKTICHLHHAFLTLAPLNDSCPLPASHFLCSSALWIKEQTYFVSHSRRSLLGNWCQRGRERSQQRLILPIGGERENTQGERVSQLGESNIIKTPDAWCSRGEMSHVFKRGKTCQHV